MILKREQKYTSFEVGRAHPAVLRRICAKLPGSGSRLTTTASGHSSLKREVA